MTNNARIARAACFAKLPEYGLILFLIATGIAVSLYPGGSQASLESIGFDWQHNYLCNLFNASAMNGAVNPGRPFAILGLIAICAALLVFFIRFALIFTLEPIWRKLISWSAAMSMLLAALLFTEQHDVVSALSSIAGLILVIGLMRELRRQRMYGFFYTAIACLLLLALNNFVYYSHIFIQLLPLLQKLSFVFILAWIFSLNNHLRRVPETGNNSLTHE